MAGDELELLFDEEDIEDRIGALAESISKDYAGRELVIICILKGAAIFAADLARLVTVPVVMDFVRAASYGSGTQSSGDIRIERDISLDIQGRHVLIVDGIADTGRTLARILERYRLRRPASIRVAVLLDKRAHRAVDVLIDYRGFEIPDRFVVGYGMDAGERYRNLPYIAALETGAGTTPVSGGPPSGGNS
jgi:hypoxanthine phosphoribosyltransferase